MDRTTPDFITELRDNEVFVFGSNTAGRHGKGAAKTAMKWGAKYGIGEGLQGNTYALPTVNASITNKLSLEKIKKCVDNFIECAKQNPDKIFLVTEVGCGLAGWTVKDIAPLFENTVDIENIYLPKKFWHKIKGEQNEMCNLRD